MKHEPIILKLPALPDYTFILKIIDGVEHWYAAHKDRGELPMTCLEFEFMRTVAKLEKKIIGGQQ